MAGFVSKKKSFSSLSFLIFFFFFFGGGGGWRGWWRSGRLFCFFNLSYIQTNDNVFKISPFFPLFFLSFSLSLVFCFVVVFPKYLEHAKKLSRVLSVLFLFCLFLFCWFYYLPPTPNPPFFWGGGGVRGWGGASGGAGEVDCCCFFNLSCMQTYDFTFFFLNLSSLFSSFSRDS